MRNQWRLLLLRCRTRPQPHISRHAFHSQVHSLPNFRFFSSLIHSRALHAPDSQFQNPRTLNLRHFSSSELAIEHKDSDHVVLLNAIFSKVEKTSEEIKLELESNGIVISHELVLKVLRNPDTSPDVARRFFDWVSECEGERLSSKSYNLMLGVLGANGYVKEFWDLVGIMKKKGYGVKRGAHDRVFKKFEKDGLSGDLEKLKQLFVLGSAGNSIENWCSLVCEVVRKELWGEGVEKRLRKLNVPFSNDLVVMVLEKLGTDPNKALIFFRWVEESDLFKHEERTYNAMARVLRREECIEKFWRVVEEMRNAGYEMEKETYIKVLGQYVTRKMTKDAVDLYEFAMGGANKPSIQDCTFLLKKIVVAKELDMDLFLKVVKVFTEGGNVLTSSSLDAVLKSLTSVGRFGECNKILKAMEEGGFLPSDDTLQGKIAFGLSSDGKKDEANEFMDNLEASGCKPNYKTWVSLIEGYCVAGDLDQASDCFQKMVDKEGPACSGYPLALLVNAYCDKNRARDAFKLLSDTVNEKELKAWHPTYKALTKKLLVQRGFKEALSLLALMKSQGFPPFVGPFIHFVSKTGTTDDAMSFLKAVTTKKYPSTSVFLQVFESYFKAGKHSEAQDLLSKCPGYIRNHADVLNLFLSMKSEEAGSSTAVAA